MYDYAEVGVAVDTPWGDRNVRVGTPDGVQLTFFTPQRPAIDGTATRAEAGELLTCDTQPTSQKGS